VATDNLIHRMKKIGIRAKSTRYRAQSSYVLRMIPPGVVTAAVGVGNEGDGHAAEAPLSDRLAPAVYKKKNRAVAKSCCGNAGRFIENLESMQPNHVRVRIGTVGIKRFKSCSFH